MHQLKDVLWSELSMWHKRLPSILQSQFAIRGSDQDLRFYMVKAPESSFAVGRTGRKENPEALQGFHSENLLFVLDEASGIDDIIFEVAGGALSTHDAKILMTANPTRTSGYFYDAFHKNRDRWVTMKVSCQDSTRVSKEYIENAKADFGEDSNIYRVRVLGDFPSADDDAVIPLDIIEAAAERDVDPIEHMPVWGLDVARFGNCRTALAKRKGNVLLEPVKSWYKRDLMEVAGILMHEYEDTPSEKLPAEILIDSVGLGAGVLDRARELGLPVRGINVGETASGSNRYTNLKAELWWRARDWFDSKEVKIPDDQTLIGQLCSVKYKFTSSGKIQIESKEQMMERGLKSPDEADSFVLTMAGGTKRMQEKRYAVKPRSQKRPTSWITR